VNCPQKVYNNVLFQVVQPFSIKHNEISKRLSGEWGKTKLQDGAISRQMSLKGRSNFGDDEDDR